MFITVALIWKVLPDGPFWGVTVSTSAIPRELSVVVVVVVLRLSFVPVPGFVCSGIAIAKAPSATAKIEMTATKKRPLTALRDPVSFMSCSHTETRN
jgi:hypothetical protein